MTFTGRYTSPADRAFIEVLAKASDAQRPGRIGAHHGTDLDRALELKRAVKEASAYCDEGLLTLMHTFQDSVIELTMGGGSEAEVRLSREKFTTACRQMLDSGR